MYFLKKTTTPNNNVFYLYFYLYVSCIHAHIMRWVV